MKDLLVTPYTKFILIVFLIYIVTAFFSIGYYHPDEHFQILEFCNYKLGNLSAEKLPWEFHEKIRPALQPVIALGTIKLLNIFSIYNPFIYTLVLRIISALIAWFILARLTIMLTENFSSETGKRVFLFFSLLFGFVPFLSVRFSSENYSAIAFLGAVCFILKYRSIIKEKVEYRLIFVGLLLGLSFFFRFQIAFAVFGVGMWLIIINKIAWKNLMIILLSGVITILICVMVDWWFYEESVITPYNYFYSNIIENKASDFGVEPWWYYFSKFIKRVPFPFGILLLLLFFIGLLKKPKDIMVWSIIPFVLAHIIVGHKELRFLFPVTFQFTYLVAVGLEHVVNVFKIHKYWRVIFVIIIILNLPALATNMFFPADKQLYFYKYLYDKSPDDKILLVSRELNTLYKTGLETYFYESPNITCVEFKNDTDFFQFLNKSEQDTIYVLEREIAQEGTYAGYTNKSVLSRYPGWILKFNINNWQSRVSILNLQELVKIE